MTGCRRPRRAAGFGGLISRAEVGYNSTQGEKRVF